MSDRIARRLCLVTQPKTLGLVLLAFSGMLLTALSRSTRFEGVVSARRDGRPTSNDLVKSASLGCSFHFLLLLPQEDREKIYAVSSGSSGIAINEEKTKTKASE